MKPAFHDCVISTSSFIEAKCVKRESVQQEINRIRQNMGKLNFSIVKKKDSLSELYADIQLPHRFFFHIAT